NAQLQQKAAILPGPAYVQSDTSWCRLGVELWYKTTSKGCSSLTASVTHPQQAEGVVEVMQHRGLVKLHDD
ncbi:hypothetical protein Tco_1120459, partial [Tanacetum coccineum]